jgi:hypothetical protein
MNEHVKLFSKLFEAKQIAHVFHLQVKAKMGSNAEHMALGIFYDKVGDKIDDLIEIYQAQFGIVEGYDVINSDPTRKTEPVDYFKDLVKFIEDIKFKAIPKELSHLHNILDEIVALTYHTIYRLTYLK